MISNARVRRVGSFFVVVAVVASLGCVSEPTQVAPATPPPPPSTRVYFVPTHGQSAEQQDRDKYECNGWAVQQSGFDPSLPTAPPHLRVLVTGGPPPGSGIATGAAAGAVLGAAVSQPWESGEGALVGALLGAAIGGLAENAAAARAREQAAGNAAAARDTQLEQKASNFRRAMSACLEGRGYEVR